MKRNTKSTATTTETIKNTVAETAGKMKDTVMQSAEQMKDTAQQMNELYRKSVEETIELGIKMQDEMLAAMDRQVGFFQDSSSFALENQKVAVEQTKANLLAGRNMWREGLENWSKLVGQATPRF